MCFVDDNNLIFQADVERFSSVLLQQQIIRKCDKLLLAMYGYEAQAYLRLLYSAPRCVVGTNAGLLPHRYDVFDVLHRCQDSISRVEHGHLVFFLRQKLAPCLA